MEPIETIVNQVNEVVNYSQGYDGVADCESIVKSCLNRKKLFIDLFGGELIYEFPEKMSFELAETEKDKIVTDFCNHLIDRYDLFELSNFIYSNKKGFFQNMVVSPYTSDTGIKINKNNKILRAFKYFIEDKDTLRKIQDEASMLIQKNKVTGTICFSIHPLDFLSSSENNNNWRSCHALDGEFRAGNLSYMLDTCTFMVYMKTDEEVILPNFPPSVPWNNKIWRCLMFISCDWDMIFAGRQYPFQVGNTLNDIMKMASEQFKRFGEWTPFCDKKIDEVDCGNNVVINVSPHVPVGNKLIPMKELVKDYDEIYPLHFNDLLRSTCYNPMYSYRINKCYFDNNLYTNIATSKTTRFLIGNEVYCPCCGKNKIKIPETMACISCEESYGSSDNESFEYCSCCGRRFYYEDGYYVEYDEETVCPECYGRHVSECSICGITAYDSSGFVFYDEEYGDCICEDCLKESRKDGEC